jgi:hypothetical protein
MAISLLVKADRISLKAADLTSCGDMRKYLVKAADLLAQAHEIFDGSSIKIAADSRLDRYIKDIEDGLHLRWSHYKVKCK